MKRNRSKDLKMIDNRLIFSFHTTVGRTYNETQAASAEIQQDTSAHRARKKGKQSAHSPTFSAQFSTASCLVVFTYVSLYLHATVLNCTSADTTVHQIGENSIIFTAAAGAV